MLTQRLGSSTQTDPKFIDALIEQIKANPGSVDEVWFATMYGFPPLEVHRRTAEILAETAEKFRALGIRVSLQLSNSIGHGEYMSALDCSGLNYEGSPAEHMVGFDGTTAGYCYCWNGEHMRSYIEAELYEYVSRIKPYCVFIDDDLRASNHAPVSFGCYCDDCMAKFNARYGSSFTREELVNEVSFGDLEWRKKHIEFLRSSLYDFTYRLGTAIHSACPDTRMGYQYCANGGYTGFGYDFIFGAMKDSTGHNPCSRPGGGSYDDYYPATFIDKAELLDYQNYMLPEYVRDIRPEIESLPDIVYGKSIGGTAFETSYYLASGATAMSYAIMMNDYEPMEWHGKMLAEFARNRPFWLRLAETSADSRQTGLSLVFPKTGYLRKCTGLYGYSAEYYRDAQPFRFINVPVAFTDDRSYTMYLSHGNEDGMTDDEIRELMKCPVILSADCLNYLIARGFEFPCTVESVNTLRLFEKYTDHIANSDTPKGSARKWGGQFSSSEGYALFAVEGKEDRFEPLGVYATSAKGIDIKAGASTSAVITTEYGAKWAVFGFDFPQRKISTARRNQLLGVSEYISGKRFAAELLTPIQGVLQPRINAEGRTVRVCFSNTTVGDSGELRLVIRKPASTEFTYMSQFDAEMPIAAEKTGEDEYTLTIPSVHPYSVCAVFCG